jgi:hypothetical protein
MGDPLPFAVATHDVLEAMRQGTAESPEVVATWLRLRPPIDEVRVLVRQLNEKPAHPVVREALTAWAQDASEEERTSLAIELFGVDSARGRVMRAIASGGSLDEKKVVARANRRIRQLKSGDKRLATARTLSVLPLSDPAAVDRVVDLIYWLSGNKRPLADLDVLRALIPSLEQADLAPNDKVSKAIQRGSKRGLKLTTTEGTILRQRDVGLHKRWFRKKVAEFFGLGK